VPLPLTGAIKKRVIERAIENKAPYHRGKNSVGDAIIIETYAELACPARRSKTTTYAFVTHNTKDFSDPHGDRRNPHPDLATIFEKSRSTYWISMVDCINHIAPELLADHDFEINYFQQPRRLSEILEAEHRLFRQIWYGRHWVLRTHIEEGTHHVVPEKDYSRNPYRPDQTLDSVWARALEAAKKNRRRGRPRKPWAVDGLRVGHAQWQAICLAVGSW
jgi:hypothetical protein